MNKQVIFRKINNTYNMSSISFNIVNIFLMDGDDSYNIMDILVNRQTNAVIVADILSELKKLFKKDRFISGTVAGFYENLPYKLFNYIFVKEFDGDMKKIQTNNPELVLVYKDKKLSLNFETDISFGLSLGFFLSYVQNDM